MALPIYRLRIILAAVAAILTLAVASMYFYARSRTRNVLNEVPNKIGFDIKQTANGFQFSKSDGKRTLFTVQATNVKQFKLNGRAELHNVNIVLYGRDSSRYDQIYGNNFSYDPQTGDVTAEGEVQIDLVANPTGLTSPDQSTPKELKNPIHLKTRDLVFNKESGNAATNARVEFRTPQATGWADGIEYSGKTNALTLSAHVHIEMMGAGTAVLEAEHGIVINEPRQIVLTGVHLDRDDSTARADQVVFFLGAENQVQRALATGEVSGKAPQKQNQLAQQPAPEVRERADQAEFFFSDKGNLLKSAVLTGNVHVDQSGSQPIEGDAGHVTLDFVEKQRRSQLQKVHASDGAHLRQKGAQTSAGNPSQDFELAAPTIDFNVLQGRFLQSATTSGAAQITITPSTAENFVSPPTAQPQTIVTAGRFDAMFTNDSGRNHLTSVHGAPTARIVNSTPGQPDRVSTSDSVDAAFLEHGGVESLVQKGNVAYTDNLAPDKRTQASAQNARYTPADQMLVLIGNPRVSTGAMITTARIIRINRASGDALAQDDVKSTYSELKEQPNGALLASSSPIHVTAQQMTAHRDPGIALYSGNARLWQDANVIESPTIQFDRDRRFVIAQGTSGQPAQTILDQTEKDQTEKSQSQKEGTRKESAGSTGGETLNRASPIAITAMKLTYADAERKVHYEGGVFAKGSDFTASAQTADAYLLPHSLTSANQSAPSPGRLDRMIAQGNVVIQQPKRRAEGQTLVYTTADDKFVLTGGPPSIFDAEQGKITGVSLTFFRHDDRVLVEGEASTPVATATRVAH